MPPRSDGRGVTLLELLVVLLLMGILSAAVYRIFRFGSGFGGRQADATATLSAFTNLCEQLQRDLAGTLPSKPAIGDCIWEIRPSTGAGTISYRIEPSRLVITREEPDGKRHSYPFIPARGVPGPVKMKVAPAGEPRALTLELKIVPNASFPGEILERTFSTRVQPSDGSFFGERK